MGRPKRSRHWRCSEKIRQTVLNQKGGKREGGEESSVKQTRALRGVGKESQALGSGNLKRREKRKGGERRSTKKGHKGERN